MDKRTWTGISLKKVHRHWMKEIRQIKRMYHVQIPLINILKDAKYSVVTEQMIYFLGT